MLVRNLRESREELDLKQKDIAAVLNVHFSTVSGWETGKDTIPIKQLIKYANLYNYSLDYLKPFYECKVCNDTGFVLDNNYKTTKLDGFPLVIYHPFVCLELAQRLHHNTAHRRLLP